MSGRPSGTVTFLFTDIQGSTSLWEQDPVAMRAALARHDAILGDAIGAHDGWVFSRGGDGLAAAFRRAGDAVEAAVDAQRALIAEAWPPPAQLRVRMGLDTGEVFESDGDYHGTPVNRAARLMAAAGGGQIVLSDVTASLLATGREVALKDLGLQRLRGLVQPVHAFGVVADGVVAVDRPLATADAPGNLPSMPNGWFGSTAELHRRVADLRGRRLVTLTGTGGVGKTRLAVEIGSLAADDFPGGVWLVELAPIADPEAVVMAVMSTLSVRTQFGVSVVDSIVDWLRGRRVLLIIDNCEHVVVPVADLCAAIVAGCPDTTVLATSREPLGVSGERVVSVASLSSSDGIELFCDRASAADEALLFAGTTSPPSLRSANGSTAFRWRSSWPPRGVVPWHLQTCSHVWTTGSGFSAAAARWSRAPSDAARHGLVVLSAADRRRTSLVRPRLGVRRRLRPRCG